MSLDLTVAELAAADQEIAALDATLVGIVAQYRERSTGRLESLAGAIAELAKLKPSVLCGIAAVAIEALAESKQL